MQTLRHGKFALVSGLTWSVVDPHGGGKHKQFAQWRAGGSTHGVGYSIVDVEVYARTEESANGLISIGRLAAVHPKLAGKTALLLIEVPSLNAEQESFVIVVGLNRGFVELDKIVFLNELSAVRSGFFAKIGKKYESFGDGPNVGDLNATLTLDELLAPGKATGSRFGFGGESVRASKIKPLSSGRAERIAVGALILLGLTVGAAMLWESSEDARRAKEQADLRAQRTPQVIYQQAIDEYLAQPYVPLSQAIEVVREGLKDFPTIFGGWALEKVNCNVDACIAQWLRLSPEGGTIEDFRKRSLPGWGPVTSVSQTVVSHVIPLKLPTTTWKRETWPKYIEWADTNVNQWQAIAPLGWVAEIVSPALQAIPPELNGSQAMGDLNAMPTAIRAAELSIVNMPLWFADLDADSPTGQQFLSAHTSLQGDIELLFDAKSVNFSAKGLIHVQN